MWGQVQGILTGDPLHIGTDELLIKTLHFYHFHPTLRIKEGVHILFFSNPFSYYNLTHHYCYLDCVYATELAKVLSENNCLRLALQFQ